MNSEGPEVTSSLRNSCVQCCVIGCRNAYYNTDKSTSFYSFPKKWYERERRQIWINRVRGKCDNDTTEGWQPKSFHKICSAHFVGNVKSNIANNLSYNPTIFPKGYKKGDDSTTKKEKIERKITKLSRKNMPKEESSIVWSDKNCSMEFGKGIPSPKRRRLKGRAVPSQNLPSRRKALHMKTRKRRSTRQHKSTPSDEEPTTSTEFPKFGPSRRKNTESRKNIIEDSIGISDDGNVEPKTEPFVFVDPNKIEKNSSKLPSPNCKFRPIILRKPSGKTASKGDSREPNQKNVNSKFNSIATQTEPLTDSNKSKEVKFCERIEYLRENLLGKVLKTEKNTLRITECIIGFDNGVDEDEKVGKLVIEPDKFITMGNIPSGSILKNAVFESSKPAENVNLSNIDGSSISTATCSLLSRINRPSTEVLQSSSISFSENLNCNNVIRKVHCDIKDIADTKNTPRTHNLGKKLTKQPIFSKDIKVALCKLPDSLVNAVQKGDKVEVDSQEFRVKGFFFRKNIAKLLPKDSTVNTKPLTCTVCSCTFSTSKEQSKHKCHIGMTGIDLQSAQDEMSVNVPTEITQPCVFSQSSNSKTCMSTPKNLKNDCKTTNEIAIVKKSEKDSFDCDLCYKSFKYSQSLDYHKKVRHGIDVENHLTIRPEEVPESEQKNSLHYTAVCTECMERFKTTADLDKHLLESHQIVNKTIRRRTAKKMKAQKEILESEQESTLQETECPECPMVFRNTAHLDRHLLEVHKIVIKKSIYRCDSCNKVFITYRSLMYHKEKDHNEKINEDIVIKLKCLNCKKLFEVDYYRNEHIKECKGNNDKKTEHDTELCPECPRRFRTSVDLDQHLIDKHKIVINKSIYRCDSCIKVFITYQSLVYHKNKAHNVKINEDVVVKLKCSNCKKLFEIDYYKNKHIKECKEKNNKEIEYDTLINELLETSTGDPEDFTLDKSKLLYYHEELLEAHQMNVITDDDSMEKTTITKKRKHSSEMENEDIEQKKIYNKESHEVFNRVKLLLESSEGPNDITFEEMNE